MSKDTSNVEEYLYGAGGGNFQAFVDHDFTRDCAKIQDRIFFNSCVLPRPGQRVEVRFNVANLPAKYFFLSGEITKVKAPPIESIRPMQTCTDTGLGHGSMGLSGALVPRGSCSNFPQVKPNEVEFGHFCVKCRGVHMARSDWEQKVPDRVKKAAFAQMESWHRPVHGHEVVCAVRLHYNWDMKRGTDDGPWSDGIPFDGRDIWRLTLVANDGMKNPWVLKDGSLKNLGRDIYPRCWPWCDKTESPYERNGIDRFDPLAMAMRADFPFDTHVFDGPKTDIEGLLRSKGHGKLAVWVDNDTSHLMESIQGKKFLKNRVVAIEGQRVEVFFQARDLPACVFILSGKVTKVHPAPTPMQGIRPMKDCQDRGVGKGSTDLSGMLVPWIPCPTCLSNHCNGAKVDQDMIDWGYFCKKCGGLHGSNWEQTPNKVKSDAFQTMLTWGAAFHGQEVVCAVRLNFSWDRMRGTEEGPWNDGIPFDGRDVWQLTLVADDSKRNVWQLKPGSLVNLGRNRFPRCWPWNNGNQLPYSRDGVDRFDRDAPMRPKLCLGPFGCNIDHNSVLHEHDLAGAA